MRWQTIGYVTVVFLAVVVMLTGLSPVLAQTNGDTGDTDTDDRPGPAGIVVDAQGVLRKKIVRDPAGLLTRERIAAARAAMGHEVAAFSKLRKISLNRLEQAIVDRSGAPTDEMRYLAGLQRVRYVFFYPDSGDIVIAGPAEGWVANPAGRVVGIRNGRSVIELQDLVVALRAFPPGGDSTEVIGCSIDPTAEGLAAMQRFLRSIGAQITPNQTPYIVNGLQTSLGRQNVSIGGIPPNTHFAQVMVEADYRMKLIGIGLERPPVRLASYVDRARPSQVAGNALQRWFFTPDYHCVRASEDGMAMELVGDGVKLVGEAEAVMAGGVRKKAARGNRASDAFVADFTKRYSELADRSPVYAQLRNLIDLCVAAAFVQQADYYGRADWKMKFFGDEDAFAVEIYNSPKYVDTVVAARWKGNRLMTPVGGGVHIEPTKALDDEYLLSDEKGKVARLHKEIKPNLAKGQWWWD